MVAIIALTTMLPPISALAVDGPPTIEGPQSETVQPGEVAIFTASIDRAAGWKWLSKPPGSSDFAPMSQARTISQSTVSVAGAPSLDGMQIMVEFTISGQRVDTQIATLHVVAAGAPVTVADAETSIGGSAEFSVTADASVRAVRWQHSSATTSPPNWEDVPEDADHVGTTTRTLILSGSATAIIDNGDHYRAVLSVDSQTRSAKVAAIASNSATLTVDDFTIAVPDTLEPEVGESLSIPVTVQGTRTERDFSVAWIYSLRRDFVPNEAFAVKPWLTLTDSGWYGTGGALTPTLTISGSYVKSWGDYYFRARLTSLTDGKMYVSSPTHVVAAVPAIDHALPVDVTVRTGQGAKFVADFPGAPYTSMTWERRSATSPDRWTTVTSAVGATEPGGAVTHELVLSTVTMADNRARFRPVFTTTLGVPHYGNEAILTVTPVNNVTGIYFDPTKQAFRDYIDGVDQNLSTGLQSIDGKEYLVADGAIKLGLVTDPSVPGGRAFFTLADGMIRNRLIVDGDSLRYFEPTGAQLIGRAETISLFGKTYVFDAQGRGVQVVSDNVIGAGGPGQLSVRLVETDGLSTGVQFSAAREGALGDSASGSLTVQVGNVRSTQPFSSDASLLAAQLSRVFAEHRGQSSVGSISVTVSRDDGSIVMGQTHSVACQDVEGSLVGCGAPAAHPSEFQGRLNSLWAAAALPVTRLLHPDVVDRVGGAWEAVRRNDSASGAPAYTAVTESAAAMATHFDALTILRTNTEAAMVKPAIQDLTAATLAAFQDEMRGAITLYNSGETAALAARLAELRAALWSTEVSLAGGKALDIRTAARTRIEQYLPQDYLSYESAVESSYLRYANRDGVESAGIAPSSTLAQQETLASGYESAVQASALTSLWTFEHMADVLQYTPATTEAGRTTFTYDRLASIARLIPNLY